MSALKLLIRYAAPIVCLQWLAVWGSFYSVHLLASLGVVTMAASALGYRCYLLVLVFAGGAQMALGVIMARAPLARRAKVLQQATSFSLCLAIPSAALMLCGPWILMRCGQSAAVVHAATPYFYVLSLSSVLLWISGTWRQALLAYERPSVIWLLAITSTILHLLLSYALILGHWGFPKMGLAGAAWAEGISLLLSALVAKFYLRGYGRLILSFNGWEWMTFLRQWRISWPVLSLWMSEMLAMMVLVIWIGHIGTHALAAYQIVSQCDLFILMIPYGLSIALGVVVSQTLRRRENLLLKRLWWVSVGVVEVPLVLMSLLYWSRPLGLLQYLFPIKDSAILVLAAHLLMITAAYHLFDGVRKVSIGWLRGHGDVKAALWASLSGFWGVTILGAWICKHFIILTPMILWLWLAAGIVTATTLTVAYTFYSRRINKFEENAQVLV